MQFELILTFFVVFISSLILSESSFDDMTYVQSNVNGKKYRVRKRDDCQQAADMLGEIHLKLENVCNILHKNYPNDPRTIRLINRFPNTTLQESAPNSSQTSYSINKGEKIVLCLRSKNGTNQLVNKNLLLFVALHELAHVMTISIGHKQEFWDNFKFVLKECQKKGIYKCIDFQNNPQKYCGITVTSSPLSCSDL